MADELDAKQELGDDDISNSWHIPVVDLINANLNALGQQLEEPDSPWLHYLLLRATNKFYSENGAYPGYYDDNVETDITKLKVLLDSVAL